MAQRDSKPSDGRGKRSALFAPKHSNRGSHASGRTSHRSTASIELQQKFLDIFRDALRPSLQDHTILQEVKGHLFDRDFAAAFGKDEYLRVYASRWSPGRSLAYLQVLQDVATGLRPGVSNTEHRKAFNVVCLGGGGGGELVAFAAWWTLQLERDAAAPVCLQVDVVDIADWSRITNLLQERITVAPEMSKYASQARKDSNRSLLQPDNVSVSFHKLDLLDEAQCDISQLLADADMVTCMFILNELYSTSVTKTQIFLARVTEALQPGSYLLVVDSPGSYSTVSINGTEKKYPMQWLLDFTLLGHAQSGAKDDRDPRWVKTVSQESQWFRLPRELQYPIELEDMRYQIHLYERRAETGA